MIKLSQMISKRANGSRNNDHYFLFGNLVTDSLYMHPDRITWQLGDVISPSDAMKDEWAK